MQLIVALCWCGLGFMHITESNTVVILLYAAHYIIIKNSSSVCHPGQDYYSCQCNVIFIMQ